MVATESKHLPTREEYYRPARARQLREQADRIERWRPASKALGIGIATCWGPGLLLLFMGIHAVFGVGAACMLLQCGVDLALQRAAWLRKEADRLDAEHAARYGE